MKLTGSTAGELYGPAICGNGVSDWIEMMGKHCLVSIQARPPYCDRGAYLLTVELREGATAIDLNVDWADAFPRYYFFPDCLAKELHEWMRVRGQLDAPTEGSPVKPRPFNFLGTDGDQAT